MKKILLLIVFTALGGCTIGDFGAERDRLYGTSEIATICEGEPDLCNDTNGDW